jgi:cytochrome oxidase assembly protein ShyY1
VVLGVGLFGSLGTWQLRRLGEAERALAAWEQRLAEPPFLASAAPPDPADRRAVVAGRPLWERHTLLTNQVHAGQIGFHLIVPVDMGTGAVLVDLGWVPAEGTAEVVERERAKGLERTFEGLARVLPEKEGAAAGFPPEADGFLRYWRAWSPVAMGQGVAVAPYVLLEGPPVQTGGRREDVEPPVGGWEARPHQRPHAEYAMTWFGILLVLISLWVHGSLVVEKDRISPGE